MVEEAPSRRVFEAGERAGTVSGTIHRQIPLNGVQSRCVAEEDSIARSFRTLFLFAAALSAVAAWPSWLSRRVTQPVAFNHNVHVEELGLECVDCHRWALVGVRATIPNIEVCADCHEEVQTESAEEARVVEYVTAGEPIPWQKVYRVPDHVFFSHRRHASIGDLGCEVCHGDMAQRVEPVTRPTWRPTMESCMECHDESGVSNDCIYCHR